MSQLGEGQGTGRRARWRGATVLATVASGLAAGAVALVLSASPASAAPVAPSACSTGALLGDTSRVDSIESNSQHGFLARLNDLRRSKGLGALAWNGELATHAIGWSDTMSAQDWLHHARDTGAGDGVEPHQDYVTIGARIVPNWRRLAENVGVSGMYSSCTMAELEANAAKAVDALHRAFVNSPGHYGNMVGDHNQVGIGVKIDPDEMWVTVRFAKGDLPSGSSGSASVVVTPATAAYIDSVYTLFAGRAASSGEKSYWAAPVSSGNRLALTHALSITDAWAGTRINQLYQTVFGRSADSGGRSYWLGQIKRGLPLESVGVEFYSSTEYYWDHGSTRKAWVRGLYDDLLGRPADSRGVSYWVDQLVRGQPRSAVAANFYRSNESRRDRTATLHQDVFGSPIADPGLQQWADRLAWVGDIRLAAEFAASQTYWNMAT